MVGNGGLFDDELVVRGGDEVGFFWYGCYSLNFFIVVLYVNNYGNFY